jgi:hypothetical protein
MRLVALSSKANINQTNLKLNQPCCLQARETKTKSGTSTSLYVCCSPLVMETGITCTMKLGVDILLDSVSRSARRGRSSMNHDDILVSSERSSCALDNRSRYTASVASGCRVLH